MKQDIALLTLLTLALPFTIKGQKAKEPGIGAASCSPLIVVEVNLHAGDKRILVPYCGKGIFGANYLCSGMTRLEVETPTGWREARLRYRETVLGVVRQATVDFAVIPPDHGLNFQANFSPEMWAIDRKQRLRLVVDTWYDEQSMRSGGQSTKLTSPAFECPLQYKP